MTIDGKFKGGKNNKVSLEWASQGYFVYNGLDRVDNLKPHIEDNIVPCCHQCNQAKSKFTQKQFYSWIKLIYNNLFT
jgi:hypothetical protein